MLSFLATGNFNGVVQGVNDLQKQYVAKYGPGNYMPDIPLAYWSFRLMIGFGAFATLISVIVLWLTRKGRSIRGRWFGPAMIALPFLPILANSFGWIFTESGRQPWVVFGLFKTADGVSPNVGVGSVAFTVIVFTLLYGALAVIEFGLMRRAIKVGPEPEGSHAAAESAKTLIASY
jgi:cytochrome d ubiquinol oxidase subunit I